MAKRTPPKSEHMLTVKHILTVAVPLDDYNDLATCAAVFGHSACSLAAVFVNVSHGLTNKVWTPFPHYPSELCRDVEIDVAVERFADMAAIAKSYRTTPEDIALAMVMAGIWDWLSIPPAERNDLIRTTGGCRHE